MTQQEELHQIAQYKFTLDILRAIGATPEQQAKAMILMLEKTPTVEVNKTTPGFLSHLVSIEDLAADFGVSVDAYRKRYTNNPKSGFPKPAFTRPTVFFKEDITAYFAKEKNESKYIYQF